MAGSRNAWRVLVVLCLGQSVALMDTTVVNVAIPTIIDDLGAGLDQILWMINGYTLTYVALLVAGGRLGDVYGQKRLFLSGIATFVFFSALCGLAQTPGQLIAARLCQGVGAAMLTPPALAIISNIFPPDRRGFALGVWGTLVSVPVAIGPTIGGLVVSGLGWRWVFFINLPIGVAAIVLGWLIVPEMRSAKRLRLDIVGTVLLTAALALLVAGLIEGSPRGWGRVWGPVSVPMLLGAGLVLLVVFGYAQRFRQDRDPLVPLAVVRQRNFTLMAVVVATLPGGLGAMLLLTTILLQSGLGMSAFAAGLTIASTSLVSGACAAWGGRLTSRYGGKYVLIAGFLVWSAGIGYLAIQSRTASTWLDVVPGLLISGVGLGLVFSPPGTIAMHDVDPAMSGAASGLFNTTRLGGGLLGVAATGAVLQAWLSTSLADAAQRHATALPQRYRAPFVDAFAGTGPPDLSQAPAFGGLPRDLLDSLVRTTYHEGVTDAVRWTYLLPIAMLLAGALGTLAVRVPPKTQAPVPAEQPSRTG